ncbi:MAG: MarC family protein [Thermoplasmata archaeon]|nr:MarC family protein [Thermoplasmata archaeon]
MNPAEIVGFALATFASIFAIVDPLAVIPFFVSLTDGYSKQEKHIIIIRSVIVAFTILVIFALLGEYIFRIFGFTIHAFKIAGGLLLFTIAFEMLQGEKSKTKITEKDKEEALAREEIGIVPLGVPLLAGPGAITTVMIYVTYAQRTDFAAVGYGIIIGSIAIVCVLAYIFLNVADKIFARAGRIGIIAFSRIMGLILAGVAVQFIIDGVVGAWHLYYG